MEYIVVHDTDIVFVNRGNINKIIYRDKQGNLHDIDFEICKENFRQERNVFSGNCVADRKIDELCYVFYTSGIKTKIVFKTYYGFNFSKRHILQGSRLSRFNMLRRLINDMGYKTYDMS